MFSTTERSNSVILEEEEIEVLSNSDSNTRDDDKFTPINLNEKSQTTTEQLPLHYLKALTKDDLESLQVQFGKLPSELETLIATYPNTFWYYRCKNYIALGSNLLYLVFLINTSYEGIQSFAEIFKPDVRVPKPVAYSIGIPVSMIDSIFHMLLFSATNAAAKSTIKYALQEPWKDYLNTKMIELCALPAKSLTNTVKFAFNQTVLLSVNLTSTMTEIVDIYSRMDNIPFWIKISIVGSILYWGNYYMKKYSNRDYYEGFFKFWFNNKNHPWLLGEIWRGNIAVPFQIFLQGMISTVGLRTYPFFYYLSLASAATLGFWVPLPIMLAAVTWHSLCALYPYTYNYYMSDQEKINAILRGKIDLNLIKSHVEEQLKKLNITNVNPQELEKYIEVAIKDLINADKNLLTEKVLHEYGQSYVFKKEWHQVLSLLYRGSVGAYFFGYQILTPLLMLLINEPISMSICGTLIGAGLFAGTLYPAEKKRIMDKLIVEELERSEKEQKTDVVIDIHDETPAPTNCSVGSRVIADIFNISTGVANVFSTMGTEARILGSSSLSMLIVTITALENSFNGILFNKDKARSTLNSLCTEVTTRVSTNPATFFNQCLNKFRPAKSEETLLPTTVYQP